MDSPVTVIMRCDRVTPIGMEIIRDFDIDYCIVATEVFLVLFDSDTYGTRAFKSFNDYWQYVGNACACCPQVCTLTLGNCFLTLDGCNLTVSTQNIILN